MVFNKDMLLSDIIKADDRVIDILEKYGMHCCTCNGVYSERLQIASRVHGVNLEQLLQELNDLDSNKE